MASSNKSNNQKKKNLDARVCGWCEAAEDPNSPLKACARCKLIFYCSAECQAHHWKKKGGHKQFCVKLEDRKVVDKDAAEDDIAESDIDPNSTVAETLQCAICLEKVKGNFHLPCKHQFHAECITSWRESGGEQVCPLCRTDLPAGPDQWFVQGCKIYFELVNKIRQSNGALTWSMFQKELDEVVRLWTLASECICTSQPFALVFKWNRSSSQSRTCLGIVGEICSLR
jgi:hypothetical protein